jgi:hypothetical protein
MTDKEIIAEIEANEAREAEGERIQREDEPGNVITDAIGSIFSPDVEDRVDDDEEIARRAENDAEQRPE